jgi:hypothetical protein
LKVLPDLVWMARKIPVVWTPQNMVNESLTNGKEDFTNENMQLYNQAIQSAVQSVPNNGLIYWESFQSVFRTEDSLDGLHIGPRSKHVHIQMLLNLICNPVMRKAPAGNDCCSLTDKKGHQKMLKRTQLE